MIFSSLKPIILFLFFLLINSSLLFSQNTDCEKVISFLNEKENKVNHLNLEDPDYIPLHYLMAQDIIKEVEKFRKEVIPNYSECVTLSFSEMINRFDDIKTTLQVKYDSLALLNKKVFQIFYEKALFEYQFNNETDGDYYLQRSLQYNAVFSNAILLKLNKLLDKNLFKESLSLLHTLYYETDLNDEQEKQAIDFTDKFYDKLYQTGDSLLKMDHAAEALELFEILEIFCQNLPTAYCNDDYYHGVLRSQSGIYDSYLAIAKVAEKRGNTKVAAQFYQYAQEYLESKPYLQTYEVKEEEGVEGVSVVEVVSDVSGVKGVEGVKGVSEIEVVSEVSGVKGVEGVSDVEVVNVVKEVEDIKVVNIVNEVSNVKELKEKYDTLVLQALALCIQEDFAGSFKLFTEAKVLEGCNCFETDFRVDIMLKELSKFGLK